MEMILQALQMAGNISLFASLVLWRCKDCLLDTGLVSVIQCHSVWSCLGHVALTHPSEFQPYYIDIGAHLANSDVWKLVIYCDLSTWIAAASDSHDRWGDLLFSEEEYIKVLRTIWISDSTEQHNFADTTEESWASAMTALSNVWRKIEFSATPSHELIRLARCTVSTSFHVTYSTWSSFKGTTTEKTISRKHRRTFLSQLGETLTEAAQTATNPALAWPETQLGGIQRVSRFLEELGHRIRGDFVPGTGEVQIGGEMKRYRDWVELKEHFMAELDRLEDSLSPQNAT
jgi:hypothetical protein